MRLVRDQRRKISGFHVAVNPNFSHFSFHNKRGFDGMIAGGILPNFKGTAVHDFFKPYLKFECKHSFCNAHLLRELIGAHETTKQVWTEMMLGVLITGLDARTWRIREQSERSGFSSFLEPFFFSFHKEKKKVTERFEIKEKL
jgi:hypothetical protein